MMNKTPEELRRYIWKRIIPEPNSGCWLYLNKLHPKGYAYTTIDRKRHKLHRLSWMAHHGPIPLGMSVCHKCDIRSCLNPDHLFIGTNQDNIDDKMRKGRHRTSVKPHAIKANIVPMIRNDPRKLHIVAAQYGVSIATISRIRNRISWRLTP